jgi:hypothetical protein
MGLHTTTTGTLSDALLAIAKDAANRFSPVERDTSDNLRLSGNHSTNAFYLPASTAATSNTCLRYGWHFELAGMPPRMQNSNKAKSEFRALGDPGDSRTL